MSLDSLFQEIILTEQQLAGKTKRLQEVKVSIIKCQEKIKASTDKQTKSKEELDSKAQLLSEMRLRHDLMKKHEKQMESQLEGLLDQQGLLQKHLDKIRMEARAEEEMFVEEIRRFNSEFSLGEAVSSSQAQSESLNLQKEVDSIYKEMELENQRNSRMNFMHEEKKDLLFELEGLENTKKDLDGQLREAEALTGSLRAERAMVSQKPQIDSTCLRLKKELELYKEGHLELLRESLSSEIHFLQSKLDSSQGSQSH